MNKFEVINKELVDTLSNLKYKNGDLSDIGNEIGIIIAKHFDDVNDLDGFICGVKHGVSLTDGTHG